MQQLKDILSKETGGFEATTESAIRAMKEAVRQALIMAAEEAETEDSFFMGDFSNSSVKKSSITNLINTVF